MAFDLNSFLKNVKDSLSKTSEIVVDVVKTYTPEKWSEEKQYINAIVASMALMVYADGTVENEEVELVIKTINESEIFKQYNMQKEALELYSLHIENLTKSFNTSKTEFALVVAKIAMDIGKVKKEEWKNSIVELSLNIASSDGDIAEDEIKMLNKIKSSLNV